MHDFIVCRFMKKLRRRDEQPLPQGSMNERQFYTQSHAPAMVCLFVPFLASHSKHIKPSLFRTQRAADGLHTNMLPPAKGGLCRPPRSQRPISIFGCSVVEDGVSHHGARNDAALLRELGERSRQRGRSIYVNPRKWEMPRTAYAIVAAPARLLDGPLHDPRY